MDRDDVVVPSPLGDGGQSALGEDLRHAPVEPVTNSGQPFRRGEFLVAAVLRVGLGIRVSRKASRSRCWRSGG